jgi:SAM-dependent methyltransferase
MSYHHWEAASYGRNARFVSDLGSPVLYLLDARPGQRVLDLGCGDGALTEKIAFAGCVVVGVDSSASMIEAAKRRGLDARLGDMHELALEQSFDAVFTNAVLHWTRDINAVVKGVAAHLKPGGRFVGEFGGFGNVAAIATAVRAAVRLRGHASNGFGWYYPTAEEFGGVLEAQEFAVERVELIPRPTPLPTGMQGWLETFARSFVSGLEPSEQDAVLDTTVELLRPSLCDHQGNWKADYVRLRFASTLKP